MGKMLYGVHRCSQKRKDRVIKQKHTALPKCNKKTQGHHGFGVGDQNMALQGKQVLYPQAPSPELCLTETATIYY